MKEEMVIKMPRGDLKKFKFPILDTTKQITNINLDEIYITFKENSNITNYLFQKRLTDGTITRTQDGYYHFQINPEDTDNLNYGDYEFDIELIKAGEIKETHVGKLILTKELTFRSNEVV